MAMRTPRDELLKGGDDDLGLVHRQAFSDFQF